MNKLIIYKFNCDECAKSITCEIVPGIILQQTLDYFNALFDSCLCPECYKKEIEKQAEKVTIQ